MTKPSSPLVVNCLSLSDLLTEVPPGSTLRFSLTERTENSQHFIYLSPQIDVMGMNPDGEICRFHWYLTLQQLPGQAGRGEFWTPGQKSMYRQIPRMVEALRGLLYALGYAVKNGCYAIPDDLKPVKGDLDLIKWEEGEQDDWRWSLVAEAGQ